MTRAHTRSEQTESPDPARPARGLSRRGLLGLAGASVAGIGLGVAGDRVALAASATPGAASASASYPFYGSHQAGIVTPAQDRLHFAAFDVSAGVTRAELIELLQDWTVAAAAMSAGQDIGEYGAVSGPYDAPPEDTGEAQGLPTAALTITFGFGPTLFETVDGVDRFGINGRRPADLTRLPRRSLYPGLLQRSPGGRARNSQPLAHRVRAGCPAVVPARFRTHLVNVDRPGDPAQPVRL